MSSPVDHQWVGQRLAALAVGTLQPEEMELCQEHLSKCETCRDAAADFGRSASPDVVEGHIPSDVIARWNKVLPELGCLERSMIRSHLDQCASCREELEVLGFVPEVPVAPALEIPTPGSVVQGDSRRFGAGTPASGRMRELALTGWAVLVTIAFAWLAIVHWKSQEKPIVSGPDVAQDTPPEPAEVPLYSSVQVIPEALHLRAPFRGNGDSVAKLMISDPMIVLPVKLPPLDEVKNLIRLTVLHGDDSLYSVDVPASGLDGKHTTLLSPPRLGWVSDRYQVKLFWVPDDNLGIGPEERTYVFDLAVRRSGN